MALAIPDLKPRIYAMFVKALQGVISMPRLVMSHMSEETQQRGDVITVPIDEEPSLSLVGDFAEGITPSAGTSPVPTNAKITLDQYKEVEFQLGAKEIREVIDGIIPSAIRTRATSLAWYLNDFCFKMAQQSPNVIVSQTPFDGNNLDDLQAITKKALELRWGTAERCLVLSPDTFAQASVNNRLSDADKTGLPVGENTLTLGRQRGYVWIGDEMTRRQGTGTRKTGANFKLDGAIAVGDDHITIDALTGVLLDGDLITTTTAYAQDKLIGIVKGDYDATATRVDLYGPVRVAHADEARVYIPANTGGTHMNNIAFRKDAIMLAVRTLTDALEHRGSNPPITQTDPLTGLPLTMRVWEGHGVTRWSFSMLFGGLLVNQDRLIRIISTN